MLTPLSNVLYNPDLPHRLSYGGIVPWTQANIVQFHNLVHPVTHKQCPFQNSILRSIFLGASSIHTLLPALTLSKPTTFEIFYL